MTLTLTHSYDEAIEVGFGQQTLFRYVYMPVMDAAESPKPYFHPIHTLGGNLVSIYRPHDHFWHKGMQMTVAHLNRQNFWGGNSYVHGQGYIPLPNNGRMDHLGWDHIDFAGDRVDMQERLNWITLAGAHWIAETRRIAVGEVDAAAGRWSLDFATELRNVSDETLHIGSPTTAGRPMAGYGGLFWRGPREFSHGGKVRAAGGLEGDEIMGAPAAWLAYSGRHDGTGATSTLLFLDHPTNVRFPNKWFMRIQPFACASFAFMFDEEYDLDPDISLALRYRIVICDGELALDDIESTAAAWQASDSST